MFARDVSSFGLPRLYWFGLVRFVFCFVAYYPHYSYCDYYYYYYYTTATQLPHYCHTTATLQLPLPLPAYCHYYYYYDCYYYYYYYYFYYYYYYSDRPKVSKQKPGNDPRCLSGLICVLCGGKRTQNSLK